MEKQTVEIQVWTGAEGPCIYINNYRICGPKPWGGKPTHTWHADLKDLRDHLPRIRALKTAPLQPAKEGCPKCGGAGWLWWGELDEYDGPALSGGSDDTRYSCDHPTHSEPTPVPPAKEEK